MATPLDQAAEELNRLRLARATTDELDATLQPAGIAEAYEIQDRMIRLTGQRPAGWKVGATSGVIQDKLGVSEPIAGPLYEQSMFPAPAELAAAEFSHHAIECEFAFRIGRSLAVGDGPYTLEAVASVVEAVVPAIELISPVFETALGGHFPSRVADGAMSAGIVVGAATAVDGAPDLRDAAVALSVDGAEVASGRGADVLGDPREALVWIANHLKSRGRTLDAGMLVSTGTMTGLVHLEPGQTAEADFGRFGRVSVRFA
ncbi:MAG: fumarylacetoacetate hydrolase family protein [Pseudomonadota bacterium]